MSRPLIISLFSNWFGLALLALANLLLTPFIISQIGKEQYGVWILILSLVGQVSILDLGIKTTLTSYLAKLDLVGINSTDRERAHKLISCSNLILFLLSLLGASFLFYVSINFNAWFEVNASQLDTAKQVFFVLSLDALLQLITGAFEPVLTSRERYDLVNSINVIRVLIFAALLFVAFNFSSSTYVLALSLLIARILQRLIMLLTCYKVTGLKMFKLSYLERSIFKEFFRFGFWASLLLISGKVISQIDTIVVGAISGMESVAIYSVAILLSEVIRTLASTANTMLIPRFNKLVSQNQSAQSCKLLLDWARYNQLVSIALSTPLILNGDDFIRLWVGDEFAAASQILVVLVIPYYFILPGMALTNYLYAIEKHDLSAKLRVVEAVFNLSLSIYLAKLYGAIGVAYGTLLPAILLRGLFLPALISKQAGFSNWKYIKDAFLKPMPILLAYILILLVTKALFANLDWYNFILANSLSGLSFLILVYCICLNRHEKSYISSLLRNVR